MGFPPHLIKFLFAKKLVQKTEHPAGLNKWGRSGLVMFFGLITGLPRPVAGRFLCAVVVCSVYGWGLWREVFSVCSLVLLWHVLRAVGPVGWRGFCGCPACFGWHIFCAQVGAYFRVRLGSLVCVVIFGRVSGGCLGAVALACSVRGFGFILFVMRWIVPLCLILTAFFPPFPGACRNLAQKPLICEYNAYGVGLMFGVRGQ